VLPALRVVIVALAVVVLVAAGFLAGQAQINPIWVPVVAALGASFLTAIAAIGVEPVRRHYEEQGQLKRERLEAYAQMISASAGFITVATTVREARKLSTGPRAAVRIDNALGFMKDFNADVAPVWNAWSAVWLHGSQEAIEAANRLVDAMQPVIGLANVKGAARSGLLNLVLGEKWTDDQEKSFHEALAKIGKARIAFTAVSRRETGRDIVNLLAGTTPTESGPKE
jgi:hypothetical protein